MPDATPWWQQGQPGAAAPDASPALLLPRGTREVGPEDLGGFKRGAQYLLAQMLTSDPRALEGIVQRLVPDAQVFRSQDGSSGIMMPDGRQFFLNRPGASRSDVMGMIGALVGGAATLYATKNPVAAVTRGRLLPRMAAQALLGGAQSAAMDLGAGAMGSEEGVNPDTAAVSAGAAGVLEGVAGPMGRIAARVVQSMRSAPQAALVNPSGELTATFRVALQSAGLDPAQLSAEQLQAIAAAMRASGVANVDQAVQLAQRASAAAGGGEFGIPLSTGQRTADPAQLALEDRLRGGGGGTGARDTMQQFDARQHTAVDAARDRLQAGAGQQLTEAEVGNTVAGVARQRHDAATTAENAAWDAWRAGVPRGTSVPATGVQGFRDAAVRAIEDYPVGANTPTAVTVLERIGRFGQGADGLRPVDMVEVDSLRRFLTNARPSAPEDARAVGEIRRAFDGWLDGLVDAGLVHGDEATVEGLRRAVSASRERFGLTRGPTGRGISPGTTRTISQRLESLAMDHDLNGQQVANWLYGQSALSGAGESRRMIRTAMDGLLEGSDQAREAIRQGAMIRILRGATEEAGGYKRAADRMREALTGNGAEVTASLFTTAERAQLGRLEQQLRTLSEQRRSANPSGSAWTLLGALGTSGIGLGAGLMGGLDTTLVAAASILGGTAAGRVVGSGVREITGEMSARAATQAGPAAAAAGREAGELALANTPIAQWIRRGAPAAGPAIGDAVTAP